ncbi:NADH-quinone oxidoreductase subunit M [candidate division KSB1 bacterium]
MDFYWSHILTIVTFIPLIGAVLILLSPRENNKLIRLIAMTTVTFDFLISLPIFFNFNGQIASMQFVEKYSWISSLGISYNVGLDGISILLYMLTTFLAPLVVLSTWSQIRKNVKEFMFFILLLQTGMLGVFISLDFFLFYVFWELMLIPMYFLIGVWGGQRRIYAAVKFFIYTMFGSVLMLVAILYISYLNYTATGIITFDIETILQLDIAASTQFWLFCAFALAFAIKVPLFPFHTWLPDAHVEAPTAGSVILAGVLLKMGTYGYIRFCLPMFPDATMEMLPIIVVLSVIGIIYGAMVAMVQPDMKKLVAYSSVSHLGFVMLGLFALNMQGIQGGIIQMINHGLSTGALFLLVGMIYERTHTRMIADYGGIAKVVPLFATVLMITTLSSLGLPGLNGFIGEFLVLFGAYQSPHIHNAYVVFSATGVILAAVYLLRMYQRVLFGGMTNEKNKDLKDLNAREMIVIIPILIFIIWIGVYPKPFIDKTEASVTQVIRRIESGTKIRWTNIDERNSKDSPVLTINEEQ